MEKRLLSAVAVAVFVSLAVLPMLGGNVAAADLTDVKVHGLVVNTDHIPLEGVNVTITDDDDEWSQVTGADGKFNIEIPSIAAGEYGIAFKLEGFGVIAYFDGNDTIGGDTIIIDDTDVNAYTVVMGEKYETICGQATLRGDPAPNVRIEVYNHGGDLLNARSTDADGRYTFDCPIGSYYRIAVSNRSYEAADGIVSSLDEKFVWNFVLEQKSGTTFLFDLDLPHSLMLIGGIAGLLLLVFIVLYRIHVGRHPDSSKIHSEQKKKDQD
jgi:5-hydroxyisourate hydrolase-like protein (transthyretin family)